MTTSREEKGMTNTEDAQVAFDLWEARMWWEQSIWADMRTLFGGPHPKVRDARRAWENAYDKLNPEGKQIFDDLVSGYWAEKLKSTTEKNMERLQKNLQELPL